MADLFLIEVPAPTGAAQDAVQPVFDRIAEATSKANGELIEVQYGRDLGVVYGIIEHRSAEALEFARSRTEWLETQLRQLPEREIVGQGSTISFRGDPLPIRWDADAPRRPALIDRELVLGGPLDALPNRVQRWLEGSALDLEFVYPQLLSVNADEEMDLVLRDVGGHVPTSGNFVYDPMTDTLTLTNLAGLTNWVLQ